MDHSKEGSLAPHCRPNQRFRTTALVVLGALLPLVAVAPAQAESPTLRTNVTRDVPAGVKPTRFEALVRGVAARWSVPVGEPTGAPAGVNDGIRAAGFSDKLPRGTLGRYDFWYVGGAHRVERVRTKCRRDKRSGKRCRRRVETAIVYDQIVDADITINPRYRWNQGPRHPRRGEMDLETVLLHELGHFARPDLGHPSLCKNSPLVEQMRYGEWWRDYDDWFRIGCSNSTYSSRTVTSAGRQTPRLAVVAHRVR